MAHTSPPFAGGLPLGAACALIATFLLLLWIAARYVQALHATMDCLSTAHKPFPGGLAWLIIVPGAGYAWILFFQIVLSWAIRSEFLATGRPDAKATGLAQAVGMVMCVPLLLVPGVQIVAAFAYLALWLIFWAQLRSFRAKLLALAPR